VGCHYEIKHGAQDATVRDMVQTSRCIGSDPMTAPNAAEESGYFTLARPGDSLFCPFECDKCFFRLKGVSSRTDDKNHQILLDFIRCSYLVAFWSRSTGTVSELTRMFHEEVALGRVYDFQMFPKPMGPFPPDYDGGGCEHPLVYCIGPTYLKNTKKN
jgi:hypothetical protein